MHRWRRHLMTDWQVSMSCACEPWALSMLFSFLSLTLSTLSLSLAHTHTHTHTHTHIFDPWGLLMAKTPQNDSAWTRIRKVQWSWWCFFFTLVYHDSSTVLFVIWWTFQNTTSLLCNKIIVMFRSTLIHFVPAKVIKMVFHHIVMKYVVLDFCSKFNFCVHLTRNLIIKFKYFFGV